MAGLYFKYGVMNSSKSANLLMIRYNYVSAGFNVLVLKPALDTRDKDGKLTSRVGIECDCVMITEDTDLKELCKDADVIMIDEAQFLSKGKVDELYELSYDKVVMCFGLLTDFKRELFEGSKRLVELADSIHEIKSVCKCGKRATVSARYTNGVLQVDGEQILVGAEKEYKALCKYCYLKELKNVSAKK